MGRISSAAQPQKRDADTKLAQSRLSVLELAKELGNVAETCRQRGLDRTSFYEWKRHFQTRGFEGLKDLPPIHKSHPQTTPPEVVEMTCHGIFPPSATRVRPKEGTDDEANDTKRRADHWHLAGA